MTIRDEFGVVEDARVGIGVELVQGFSVARNVIPSSPRMDYGVRIDHLDDTVDPAYGSVVGNTVMGEEPYNVEAGLIGSAVTRRGMAFYGSSSRMLQSSVNTQAFPTSVYARSPNGLPRKSRRDYDA